jgi:hypothetical protein
VREAVEVHIVLLAEQAVFSLDVAAVLAVLAWPLGQMNEEADVLVITQPLAGHAELADVRLPSAMRPGANEH